MKTSSILFISTIMMLTLTLVFQITLKDAEISYDNKPLNSLSKFWMDRYDIHVQQSFAKPIKYLKIAGNDQESHTYITIKENKQPGLFSSTPLSFTHELHGDTLILRPIAGAYSAIEIKQPRSTALELLTLARGDATINGFREDELTLHVSEGSTLLVGSAYARSNERNRIGKLHLYVKNSSTVSLDKFMSNTVEANLENGILKYTAGVEVDTMQVNLKGRSTVLAQQAEVVNQVKNLFISGNQTYFKKERVGKNVGIIR